MKLALWFAFILLSLSYWQQPWSKHILFVYGCDLLSFYYLCRTDNNRSMMIPYENSVVICFHFTIFVVLTTTFFGGHVERLLLWFAFILLSLSYWQQLFYSSIFGELSCDLLSFYYLCRTDNNVNTMSALFPSVVICFHFTIFVVLTTTIGRSARDTDPLWFAFILLSLSYWQQRWRARNDAPRRCDLLSFYYLCRTDNNTSSTGMWPRRVVICFHFTIFVVLTTTPPRLVW